jgi:phospholipid/cholesterol/gamma-HCH transport system substrate-binding protein
MGKNSYALLTGLFLTILATATIVIVVWLGDFQAGTNTYVIATHNSVTGLKAGSTVYYRGIAVGKVSAVSFDPNDPEVIIVPITVNKEITLTRGVYATLQLKGVTGLTQIAMDDSGNNPERLPPGNKPANRIPIRPSLMDDLADSGGDILAQTRELTIRLNRLLSDTNEQYLQTILGNAATASDQFIELQQQATITLQGLPALTADMRQSLAHVNALSADVQDLARQLKTMSPKLQELLQSSAAASTIIVDTTLPRTNVLLVELQSTIRRFERVAALLENDPQAFLLGRYETVPGPGEPGFEEPR